MSAFAFLIFIFCVIFCHVLGICVKFLFYNEINFSFFYPSLMQMRLEYYSDICEFWNCDLWPT